MSGITRSNVDMVAIRSAILQPLAIVSSADKFENPGDLNLTLYGFFLLSLIINSKFSPCCFDSLIIFSCR